MAVEVSKVISRATRSKTPLTGTVLPITEVTVSALMAGQVVEIKVDEGDTVNRGEVLAQLRDIDTRIDVQEAEAAVGKARSELQKQKAGSRGQEVKSKQAEVAEKKAVMEKLKRELERAETLFTQGIMNQSQRDSAEADYKTALSQYESTLASLDMTVEGSRAEDIAVAQSEVTVREAALARKQQMLRDTRILAPISGAVVKKHVEAGEWIDVGGKVVDMVDFSTVRVSIDVPEREIQSVKKGIKAEISVDAYPGTIFSGAVTQVVPAANINNRTFPVLIDIPNADFKLRSGMFARVNLIFAEEASAVLVLKDSILTDSAGKKYIFVVRDNVAHRIDVTTGLTDGNHVEVKGDLKADDLVIITGNEILRDKAPVMVVKQAT
jgi:multidrug efflux pump subunit AcrA (membrane-fusion protein)